MKVSTPAVLGHPQSAPSQSAKIFTVGGGAPKYGAPPKKRLHVLPTARWRALAMGSVAAAVRLLFYVQLKKFLCVHSACPSAGNFHSGVYRGALRFSLCM